LGEPANSGSMTMNSTTPPRDPMAATPDRTPEGTSDALDLRWLLAIFTRRWKLFAGVVIAIIVLTVIYTIHAKPVYTATARVTIDTQRLQLFSPNANQAVTAGASTDSNAVDTQVEIMRSRAVAEWVVKSLGLDQDRDFLPKTRSAGPAGIGATVLHLFSKADPASRKPGTLSNEAIHSKVVDNVLAPLDIRRLATTYVIEINYTLPDAAKAAAIANKFAEGYLVDVIATKSAATREASGLLSSRLVELSNNAARDTSAVQQYKIAHGLMSPSGTTLTEQEISNYNQQLATSKAEAAEDQARLRTAKAQMAHGSAGDDVGEALNSPVIQSLRAQRAIASGHVAELSARYGPRYPDMIKAQRQLADIDLQIRAEIERIISNLQAKAEVSRQRVASMEQTLAGARGTLAVNGRAQVDLTELEQKASASQTLYETYLSRFKETTTQQGTEQSDARIVSRAETPTVQSSPKVGLNLAFGLILALGAGIASIFLAEVLETGLITADDVERKIGARCLGGVPILKSLAPDAVGLPSAYVVEHPLSLFSEAYRNLRAALLQPGGEPIRVVGITSALMGEGKTTTAVCLGLTASIQGFRAVIVDCDLRRRSVLEHMSHAADKGLLEVLNGTASLDDVLFFDPVSGAAFLPLSPGPPTTDDVFSGPKIDALLNALKSRFELVVVDTPPILAISDARILASKCDAVILLAQWRRTPIQAVKAALRLLDAAGARVAGLALSRIDMRQQARYGYGDPAYYYPAHKQYYTQ
jgi:succinoglycan biosynthesis transport protein ExoP